MKLTRQEILLLCALLLALATGVAAKRYRVTHPPPPATPGPASKK